MSWGLGTYGFTAWGTCISGGPDTVAPTISAQSPANNSISIPTNASISLRLSDDLSGVDLGSVRITVQQGQLSPQTVFQNGRYTGLFIGFVGANTSAGYDFIIRPLSPWISSATVVVIVACKDNMCNAVTFTWQFAITQTFGCVN